MARQRVGSALALALVSSPGVLACGQPVPSGPISAGGDTPPGGAAFLGGGVSGVSGAGGASGSVGLPSSCSEHLVPPLAGGGGGLVDEICSATTEPVLAKGAVQLRLAVTDDDPHLPALGTLVFPEELRAEVRGAPVISVERTNNVSGSVSVPEQTQDGYAFEVTFGSASVLISNDLTRVSLGAAFDYHCEAGSRLVYAVTELRLCGGTPTPVTWSGPGETCVACFRVQPASPEL